MSSAGTASPQPLLSAAIQAPSTDLGASARVYARVSYRVRTLTVRENALMLVRKGEKSLIASKHTLRAGPGQALLVAQGTQWDVINDPAGQGYYEAQVLSFGDALLTAHAQARRDPQEAPAQTVTSACVLALDAELNSAVQRAAFDAQAAQASPALQRHRLMEVLLLLSERGHRFTPLETMRWDERVRRLVAQRLDAPWSVESVASAFHLSASSLQRRLGAQGTSVAALVREQRLESALGLLQTTPLAIGEIAQRCGWTSHSRFSAAFSERWGFAPKVLRTELTQPA